jgi:hypothetical protein
MAGFENKNALGDALKTIPVGAAVGGLPVSRGRRDGHEILGWCARQQHGRSVGAVKRGDTRDFVSDPENVRLRVDGQAPGVYQIRISAIGNACNITLVKFQQRYVKSHTVFYKSR